MFNRIGIADEDYVIEAVERANEDKGHVLVTSLSKYCSSDEINVLFVQVGKSRRDGKRYLRQLVRDHCSRDPDSESGGRLTFQNPTTYSDDESLLHSRCQAGRHGRGDPEGVSSENQRDES